MSNIYLAWLLAWLWTFAHTHHISNYTEGHSQPSPAEVLYNLPHQNKAPGNVDFTFKFYRQISLGETRNNILFSPLSISTVLSMLLLGAKHRTQSQLLSGLSFNQTETSGQEIHGGFNNLLHLLNDPSNEIELNLGNALFTDEDMKSLKKLLHDAKHFYKSAISHTNFKNSEQAEEQINRYIEKKTNGQFVDIIRGLETDVLMVLVNYMFMKAYWKNPFSFKNTREDYFFVDEQTVRVPMMFSNALYKTYHDTDLSCQLVEIPYKGTTSALFILPEPGKMKQVEDALEKGILLKWLHSVGEQRSNLHLPRFTIHAKYVLRGLLRRMGITDIFTDEADLSGITGKLVLKVSKSLSLLLWRLLSNPALFPNRGREGLVAERKERRERSLITLPGQAVHQVYLSVHENGTEAAAAATLNKTVPNSLSPIISFNRPFMVIISESISSSILFMGRIINPNGTRSHY